MLKYQYQLSVTCYSGLPKPPTFQLELTVESDYSFAIGTGLQENSPMKERNALDGIRLEIAQKASKYITDQGYEPDNYDLTIYYQIVSCENFNKLSGGGTAYIYMGKSLPSASRCSSDSFSSMDSPRSPTISTSLGVELVNLGETVEEWQEEVQTPLPKNTKAAERKSLSNSVRNSFRESFRLSPTLKRLSQRLNVQPKDGGESPLSFQSGSTLTFQDTELKSSSLSDNVVTFDAMRCKQKVYIICCAPVVAALITIIALGGAELTGLSLGLSPFLLGAFAAAALITLAALVFCMRLNDKKITPLEKSIFSEEKALTMTPVTSKTHTSSTKGIA